MIFINERIKVMQRRRFIAKADSFLEIFMPIFAPIKLARNAAGRINRLTSPNNSFEEKAKKAWIKTIRVMEGKINFGSFWRKNLSTAAKSIAPPIPIEALIAPINEKSIYKIQNKFFSFKQRVILKYIINKEHRETHIYIIRSRGLGAKDER